jgi:ribosomal protein S18 acetylase RimI-like enzyme
MIQFIEIHDAEETARWSAFIAEGLFATEPAYFRSLYGADDAALRELHSAVRQPNSEFSAQRTTLALVDGTPVGMAIAIPGEELARCRLNDTLQLIRGCPAERRQALRELLSAHGSALLPVAKEDYYLRALAVDPAHQGHGFGRQLLDQVIAAGAQKGFRAYRLDVSEDNAAALRLYKSRGFQVIHEADVPGHHCRTCAMRLDTRPA